MGAPEFDMKIADKAVPEIMEAVDARLRADGRLQADAEGRLNGIHE